MLNVLNAFLDFVIWVFLEFRILILGFYVWGSEKFHSENITTRMPIKILFQAGRLKAEKPSIHGESTSQAPNIIKAQ